MRKRVLFIVTGLALGGAESQLVKISLGLKKRDWEINIYSFLKPLCFQSELEGEGINVYSTGLVQRDPFPLLQFMKIEKDLHRVIRLLEPDVLVCFMFHAYFVGRIVGHRFRMPVISSIRTEKNEGLKRLLTKLTNSMSAATVFNSRIVAERAIKEGLVSRDKARVIPNGIHVDRFRTIDHLEKRMKLCEELSINPETFIWVSVGRLEKPMDYRNLLRAVKLVLEHRKDSILIIAGEGNERSNIVNTIEALGVCQEVTLLGKRNDVPELLSASDAFVLSSAWEGLPNSLIEAVASALPVVATDVGGVREIMGEPPNCGYIVPPKDYTCLANKMMELMDISSSEREKLGTNGRDNASNTFDLESILDQYEKLIFMVIGQGMEVS